MSPEAIAALINVLSDFVKIVLPAAVATAGTAGVALYAAHMQLKAKRLELTSGNEFKARESLFAYYRAEGVFACGAGGTLSCKSHGACHGHLVTLSAAYTLGRNNGEPGTRRSTMDTDLERMSREQLMQEVMKLRQGIRQHRDSTRHELCWHHPALWGLLPEKTDPVPVVPDWPQFMQGCVRYRQSLDEQAPDAPRTKEPYQA